MKCGNDFPISPRPQTTTRTSTDLPHHLKIQSRFNHESIYYKSIIFSQCFTSSPSSSPSFFLKRHHSVCQNKYFLCKQTFVCTRRERWKENFLTMRWWGIVAKLKYFQTHFKAERCVEWAEEAILIFWLKNRDKRLRSCFTFHISGDASHSVPPSRILLSAKSALFCWAVRMMKAKNHSRQPPNPFCPRHVPGKRARQNLTSDQVIVDMTIEPRTLGTST